MDSANALLENRRVPGDIHIDDDGRVLEIQPHAPGVGGEERAAIFIFAEPVH